MGSLLAEPLGPPSQRTVLPDPDNFAQPETPDEPRPEPARTITATALITVGVTAIAQTSRPPYSAPITLEQARKAIAEAEARKNNWQLVVSIVDSGGYAVMLQNLEAGNASVDIATAKARTAVHFRRATKVSVR